MDTNNSSNNNSNNQEMPPPPPRFNNGNGGPGFAGGSAQVNGNGGQSFAGGTGHGNGQGFAFPAGGTGQGNAGHGFAGIGQGNGNDNGGQVFGAGNGNGQGFAFVAGTGQGYGGQGFGGGTGQGNGYGGQGFPFAGGIGQGGYATAYDDYGQVLPPAAPPRQGLFDNYGAGNLQQQQQHLLHTPVKEPSGQGSIIGTPRPHPAYQGRGGNYPPPSPYMYASRPQASPWVGGYHQGVPNQVVLSHAANTHLPPSDSNSVASRFDNLSLSLDAGSQVSCQTSQSSHRFVPPLRFDDERTIFIAAGKEGEFVLALAEDKDKQIEKLAFVRTQTTDMDEQSRIRGRANASAVTGSAEVLQIVKLGLKKYNSKRKSAVCFDISCLHSKKCSAHSLPFFV